MFLPVQAKPVIRKTQTLGHHHFSTETGMTLSADCATNPCGVGTGLLCCNGTGQFRDEHTCCDVKKYYCTRNTYGVPYCQPIPSN